MNVSRRIPIVLATAAAACVGVPAADAAVQASQSGWAWGNPTPQGNTITSIDFDQGIGYAVGANGTALRTDDGGASWRGLATGTTQDLDGVQVVNPDTVVVRGGGGCVLRRSNDGGRTFARIYVLAERSCPDPVQTAYFVDPQVGYVILRDGSVLRTADAGQTFSKQTALPTTQAASGGGSFSPVDVYFSGPDSGIAIVSSGTAYVTTDRGNSWSPLTGAPSFGGVRSLRFVSPAVGYAVGANVVLRTPDGGLTWQLKGVSGAGDFRSIDCSTPDVCLLTTTSGDRFVRTTDGGDSSVGVTASTQPIYALGFQTADRVVAAGAGGATVVSSDGGVQYSPVGGDLGGNYSGVRNGPTRDIAFAIGADGQFATTSDGGQTWRSLFVPTSADLRDVSFVSPQVGYALDAGGGLFSSANGGQSWQAQDPGTDAAALDVETTPAGVALLAGPVGVFRQAGGGRFDPVADRDIRRARVGGLDRAGGEVVFAYGNRALARSTDAGASWRTIPRPRALRSGSTFVRRADFADSRRGYLLDTAGRVWSTRDAGRTWKESLGVGTSSVRSLSFGAGDEGFLALSRYPADLGSAYVLRTSDGGRTWRPQRLSVGVIGFSGVAAAAGGRGYALTQARFLFTTGTGGDTTGEASTLTLATRKRSFTRKSLKRARGRVTVTGTLSGAQGGEQIVVSRRNTARGTWASQVVTAGANGGSFTTTWRIARSSVFVAQWAGDSGRIGQGSSVLGIGVK